MVCAVYMCFFPNFPAAPICLSLYMQYKYNSCARSSMNTKFERPNCKRKKYKHWNGVGHIPAKECIPKYNRYCVRKNGYMRTVSLFLHVMYRTYTLTLTYSEYIKV